MTERFAEEQIIRTLCEAEDDEILIWNLYKHHNINKQTFFRWRN